MTSERVLNWMLAILIGAMAASFVLIIGELFLYGIETARKSIGYPVVAVSATLAFVLTWVRWIVGGYNPIV